MTKKCAGIVLARAYSYFARGSLIAIVIRKRLRNRITEVHERLMFMRFSLLPNSLMAMSIVISMLSSTAVHAGSIFYDVSIDTSSFSGKTGFVEFQLGGGANGVPITAAFNPFNSDATITDSTTNENPLGEPNVTVTGDLTGNTLSLYNDDSAFQSAIADQNVSIFGTFFDFRVTLTGDGIDAVSDGIATLAISVFDSLGNPFFNGPDETNNAAVFIQTSNDGTSSLTQYQVNSVPEPSSLISMLVGAIGIGVGMYRRQQLAV